MTEQDDFQLPDMFDISAEAVATAEASLDPTLKVPATARKDTDKKSGDVYYRWPEALTINKVSRARSKKGLTEFFVQAKVRAGATESKNIGRLVFSRYYLNFKVLSGLEQNDNHAIMNRLTMASLTSLLKATNFMPDDAAAGIKASLLTALFPAESEEGAQSPLVGQVTIGNIVDRPNKGDGATRDRQSAVETWMPAPVEE